MQKIIIALLLITSWISAKYSADISPISLAIKKRMIQGNSWRKGCPVGLHDLRYLQMSYIDFKGNTKTGEMIVHRSVAKEVTQIFGKLYRDKYPIRKMVLVSRYHASDFQSIEADNTSALNCRPVTGGTKWSRHSYGKAIDFNPIENPYVKRGRSSHKASAPYIKRKRKNPHKAANNAVILKNDPIVRYFKQAGWRWGGDWRSIKDYQHFDKR